MQIFFGGVIAATQRPHTSLGCQPQEMEVPKEKNAESVTP